MLHIAKCTHFILNVYICTCILLYVFCCSWNTHVEYSRASSTALPCLAHSMHEELVNLVTQWHTREVTASQIAINNMGGIPSDKTAWTLTVNYTPLQVWIVHSNILEDTGFAATEHCRRAQMSSVEELHSRQQRKGLKLISGVQENKE